MPVHYYLFPTTTNFVQVLTVIICACTDLALPQLLEIMFYVLNKVWRDTKLHPTSVLAAAQAYDRQFQELISHSALLFRQDHLRVNLRKYHR